MTFLFIIFGMLFKSHLTKCTLVPERIIEIVKLLGIQVVFILPLYLTDSIQRDHRSISSQWWDEASNSCSCIYLHHRSVIRILFSRNTIISLKAKIVTAYTIVLNTWWQYITWFKKRIYKLRTTLRFERIQI